MVPGVWALSNPTTGRNVIRRWLQSHPVIDLPSRELLHSGPAIEALQCRAGGPDGNVPARRDQASGKVREWSEDEESLGHRGVRHLEQAGGDARIDRG
jgi:hypothetical protein